MIAMLIVFVQDNRLFLLGSFRVVWTCPFGSGCCGVRFAPVPPAGRAPSPSHPSRGNSAFIDAYVYSHSLKRSSPCNTTAKSVFLQAVNIFRPKNRAVLI